ncbi:MULTISPECIES: hypothetical protein [unclassified Shinella]|uniref:hypothetical protein n=1 Tax=unclassified Shinella TaxID=2643062 RepID=UPI00234E57EC|nr:MULTISPECIES: hypothetical protein [unclassified Shinella]MCO5135987.1 hypothetical protein [Shinella sp.]MDC7254378.1 hypothetical protein [Shinella sp. YE25]
MSTDEHRKQMVAAAAVAMAQRNIAIATARYGYQPPERPATAPIASTPAPTQARNDVLVKEAARRRAEREAAEAAEAKASMARVVARMNGKEVKDPSRLEHGWGKVVADLNKRNGATATDEKPAELSGWARMIARMNARGGR